ncbi:MAG: prepilin-type N-terminal cleavage/methylation domain-containing protein [Candidatus Acididesulfobacter diazotrophicus]|jgi:prepilin-type N-terminal cleavage/methylation domain-containing protein|uniref:Prepilin-type N-terminal cleavage/methylation domain-containing protein n=1 Tax=Candidatus Acididesulfobacter diazotrophicus TaxID=2597226 RepID=A0A519BPR1_9DELT|nr:MAG: prepilin-type N-terminal cleavage/methylation domain-containing protein [Candidatus Acididesulfobacter diazotrophicus]
MKNDLFKNNKGFTLLELVMTIILIGIMSVGLYQVIIFGINDYMLNENALHQVNSMSYASSVIRRNLEEAAMPPTSQINGKNNGQICYIKNAINPSKLSNSQPIVVFNLASQSTSCGSVTEPCNAIAFYKYIYISGTAQEEELVVFCVNNNNVLYKQVTTTSNGTTTAYPISDNISGISF